MMIQKFKEAIEHHKELILQAYDFIWKHPETGYREVKTSKYLEEAFVKLGYELSKPEDIPGFATLLDTGRPGPTVMVLGELDSLICPEHPAANPTTGAVHCCGHHVQSAVLLGIAATLKEPTILDELSGKILLCAVPAEELIEIEYRLELRKQGKISYLGGKQEFLYRGYFDDVDLAFMVHVDSEDKALIRNGSIGMVAKHAIYKGISSHAGGAPWAGRNALYAANQGLAAINAIRETFRENDLIRVHPIITNGGSVVNAIPDRVEVESFVRGKSFDAIYDTNKRVNRALCGGALSLGVNLDIQDTHGYAPLINDTSLIQLAMEAWSDISEHAIEWQQITGSGSTDMGDLCGLIPVVHPYVPGAIGNSHGSNYWIENPEQTCITSVLWQLNMLYVLLKNDAERAKEIISNYKPTFSSKEAYFAYLKRFDSKGDRIEYGEDQKAIVYLS